MAVDYDKRGRELISACFMWAKAKGLTICGPGTGMERTFLEVAVQDYAELNLGFAKLNPTQRLKIAGLAL